MYNENSKNGFSIIKMVIVCLLVVLFLFLFMWLANRCSANSPIKTGENVFRENMKYLQTAGEDYFTNDKLPTEMGGIVKVTLAELYDKKVMLPFVDKNGNECNKNESYVSVTKVALGYEMKTNLVCGKESNYLVKLLGCREYCPNKCGEKVCQKEQITEYQFKKTVNKDTTSYNCDGYAGYTLSGKNCVITKLVDSKKPTIKTETKTDTKQANVEVISGTKTLVDTTKTKVTDKVVTTTVPGTSTKVDDTVVKTTTESTQEKVFDTVVVKTTPDKTEQQCTTTQEIIKYECNCTTYRDSDGRAHTTCSTCTKTVPKESCENVVIPGTTTYSCPSASTHSSGSGVNLKCWHYKTVPGTTTYSCPSVSTNSSGSGSALKCWHYKKTPDTTTYSCPSTSTNHSGSGTSLSCWHYTYSCPSTSNYSEGSGSNLKCYVVTGATFKYNCNGFDGYKLDNTVCKKTTTTETKVCSGDYKLEKDMCNKYGTDTKKAKEVTSTKASTEYKWSTSKTLSGWTSTGKTRVVEGKEVCY